MPAWSPETRSPRLSRTLRTPDGSMLTTLRDRRVSFSRLPGTQPGNPIPWRSARLEATQLALQLVHLHEA
jgi:hypothetical protein